MTSSVTNKHLYNFAYLGSKFYENEQRRNEKMKLKIAEQDKRFKELSAADIELGEKAVSKST